MSDFNREQWDELDPDQQWEYFDSMHEAYHQAEYDEQSSEGNAGTLIHCMFSMANELENGDVFGKRAETMRGVATAARSIATMALLAMPNSLHSSERVRENMAFDDIASQLENDPDFNRDAE